MDLSLSKRSKGSNIQTNNVSCLVDACNADLTHCREYHRRHKVCERHSKARMVSIGGLDQRFCQQCSRKRWDGHNRRRRKSQMDPRPLISTQQVLGSTRMFSLESLQLNPSNFMAKSESPIEPFSNHPVHLPLNQESSSSSTANKGGSNHFLYFQPEAPLATTNADPALSLLSVPPLLISQTSPVTIQQPVPFMQQMDHEAGFCDFNRNNNYTNLQLQGMFHDERGGSPPIGTQQQTLPFQSH